MTLILCDYPVWIKYFQTHASCDSTAKRIKDKEIGSLPFKVQPHFSLSCWEIDGNLTPDISSFKMNVGKVDDNVLEFFFFFNFKMNGTVKILHEVLIQRN